MRTLHLDLDALRSFTTGIALGSFARAAVQLHRSTSAVSAQLKKLEQQAGAPLLVRHGRGLALTPTGEVLHGYARRLLALNDEAVAALDGAHWQGEVRLGLQAEFGEQLLPAVLGRFGRAHPRLQVEAQIARGAALVEGLAAGQFDLALAWAGPTLPASLSPQTLAQVPLCWVGPVVGSTLAGPQAAPLPLAMLDAPCPMRSAAIAALDEAGIAWRVAFSSASLAGVWAAVEAGLGITLRTPLCLPRGLRVLDPRAHGLPAMPTVALHLHRASDSPAVDALASLVREAVAAQVAALPGGRAPRARAQASGSSER
ncbi:LysR substrate-binding domain-containing protein [Stenotrophomonas sp. HITSZ_GD]|uniref:LysR substrate-binding domain-containing protein n=1 Tax=Stenotrophomonas sp. HITSZ_GD TaxID=3037248 RepID=UPI00240E7CB2|nr:LysR substrate-binding domain-containing protein [Stenotrophomonas sp. HITSZ_GD]MDG2525269.1 LysR substrate-binding domain-containing protein [Stenotrophomonas sp. HITSZ_GD]